MIFEKIENISLPNFNENNVDTTGITVTAGAASPVTGWSGMSYSTQYFIVFGGGQFTTDEFSVGDFRVSSKDKYLYIYDENKYCFMRKKDVIKWIEWLKQTKLP